MKLELKENMYVRNCYGRIAKIEDIEMFEDNKNWWEPKEITPYTSFYCQNLCRSS